ncbi:lipase family protein [Paenibacillus sp. 1P07SE]|uniref:lipase family protein n=1 Tax=Paenibacillus sp. 1P07SE TaxID=3132209 RepID=UPI0039A5B566
MAGVTIMRDKKIDIRTAIFLAAVCSQTYQQFHDTNGTFLVPRTFQIRGIIDAQALGNPLERFGFVLESDRSIVVAFRGTGTAADLAVDMVARQMAFPYARKAGLTHIGFTELYASCREPLLKLLNRLPSNKAMYVTGHSLGGALATLAGLDIALSSSRAQPRVYTYGAPRVGDPVFARFFNRHVETSCRVSNRSDIVPRLPPLIYQSPKNDKFYYYLHVKGEYKLDFKGGSVSGNHLLAAYFNALALEDPAYAATMCSQPAGWCPVRVRRSGRG